MAVHAKEDWWALAEAARRVAELLQDPIGKGAMLDVVASCEQLASNPRLAKERPADLSADSSATRAHSGQPPNSRERGVLTSLGATSLHED